jgi:hypothetical protein
MHEKESKRLTTQENDFVAQYASSIGFSIRSRTILVEGTTDVELFNLAARLELEKTGIDLLKNDLAFVAAGERDRGGTKGVIRELNAFRCMARNCLLSNGRPKYRFIGLFDNDKAGKLAVKFANDLDSSILEYKDVFRLWPVMPLTGNLVPTTMQKTFERENADYKGLEWELEDLINEEFIEIFLLENDNSLRNSKSVNGKTHRDFTPDGKAKLHKFIKQHAKWDDLAEVVLVLRVMRFYCGLTI